jgi:RNA polymerase sigma-B factor
MIDFINEDAIRTLQAQEVPDKDLILNLWMFNQGLIHQILRKYKGLADYDDLTQEAFISFYNAVFAYSGEQGAKFSTFLSVCVTNHIIKYLKSDRLVKLPDSIKTLKIKYNRAFNELSQSQGREPTRAEIATFIGCSIEDIEALAGVGQAVSLDKVQGAGDEGATLLDTLKSSVDIENSIIEQEYSQYQKTALWGILDDCLTCRENEIIKQHYKQNKTLQEIAERQGITPQRASKIEADTFSKLRRNPKIKRLANELEIADSMLFRGSCRTFKRKQTSVVEQIALKVDEALRYSYKTREDF